jgi:UPF0148 protein
MEIKDMADLLLKGGKMLNKSCPECNTPLFQYEGKTFCPKCSWEEGKPVPQGAPTTASAPEGEPSGTPTASTPTGAGADPWNTLDEVQASVLDKIRRYSDKLSNVNEEANLESNVNSLSELLDLLNRIIEMKAKRA